MTAADKVQDAVARLERISPDRCKRQTVKDQIRVMMPAIEAARRRDMLWKEIHAEILAAGIRIEPQVLANYVCALRREVRPTSLNDGVDEDEPPQDVVVVRLPRSGPPQAGSSSPQPARARTGEPLRKSEPTAAEREPSLSHAGTAPGSGAQPEQYVETLNGDRPTKVSRPK